MDDIRSVLDEFSQLGPLKFTELVFGDQADLLYDPQLKGTLYEGVRRNQVLTLAIQKNAKGELA